MKKLFILVTLFCLAPGILFAVDKPTGAEAKKIIDYYVEGQGQGAILVDYKLCHEVSQEGPKKNDCLLSISNLELDSREGTYLWMNFLIPAGDEAKILLSFSRNGRIRKVIDFTLTGAFRFRTWKKIPIDKSGMWSIQISQELPDKDIDLAKLKYSVKELAVENPTE